MCIFKANKKKNKENTSRKNDEISTKNKFKWNIMLKKSRHFSDLNNKESYETLNRMTINMKAVR